MSDINEVQLFLNDLSAKISIWGIVYRDDRSKNAQTLLDLELLPNERTEIIKSLKVYDYSEGPNKELLYGGSDMWIFGKHVKDKEIYIKITLGIFNSNTICISFHIAEYQMIYPHK